ncbi:MAG: nuclear transport factor 2 family protein [Myxococcota bacterium]
MTNREAARDMYEMLAQGKLLEAFDKYYADDVVMDEPRGKREGKPTCRTYEEQFLASVEAFHDMGVTAMAADDDHGKVLIETWMDLTFKGGGGRVRMEQVAVQTWKDGKVVHERFYYDNSGS